MSEEGRLIISRSYSCNFHVSVTNVESTETFYRTRVRGSFSTVILIQASCFSLNDTPGERDLGIQYTLSG